jgi:hypothetical protein
MGLAIRNDSVTPRLAMVLQLGSEVLVRAGYGLGISGSCWIWLGYLQTEWL